MTDRITPYLAYLSGWAFAGGCELVATCSISQGEMVWRVGMVPAAAAGWEHGMRSTTWFTGASLEEAVHEAFVATSTRTVTPIPLTVSNARYPTRHDALASKGEDPFYYEATSGWSWILAPEREAHRAFNTKAEAIEDLARNRP